MKCLKRESVDEEGLRRQTSVKGPDKGLGVLDLNNIRDLGNVEEGGDGGHEVLSKGRVHGEQVGELVGGLEGGDSGGVDLRESVVKGSVVGDNHAVHPRDLADLLVFIEKKKKKIYFFFPPQGEGGARTDLFGNIGSSRPGHKGGDGSADLLGSRDGGQSPSRDSLPIVLNDDQSGVSSRSGIQTGSSPSLHSIQYGEREDAASGRDPIFISSERVSIIPIGYYNSILKERKKRLSERDPFPREEWKQQQQQQEGLTVRREEALKLRPKPKARDILIQ